MGYNSCRVPSALPTIDQALQRLIPQGKEFAIQVNPYPLTDFDRTCYALLTTEGRTYLLRRI